jgi:LmbE family N-acetylglucosaminyl deacetylase
VVTAAFFHAHPDDEAIATGGTMANLADAGHRVVLILATRGECGEPVPGVLEEGETLGERRTAETMVAADRLGVARVVFLGYRDSGMMGDPTNDEPDCFWRADVEAAAERLARILQEEAVEVLTVYDDHGGYGHPDHIQVHRVGIRAAALAGIDRVFEATMNRDAIRRLMADSPEMVEAFEEDEERQDTAADDDFGSPEALITHAVDVTGVLERKRSAMTAHASQISADSFFLQLPPAAFAAAFGTEWYIAHGRRRPQGAGFVEDLLGS